MNNFIGLPRSLACTNFFITNYRLFWAGFTNICQSSWCVRCLQGVAKKQVKKQVKSTPKKVADPLFPAKKKSFRIGRDIQVIHAYQGVFRQGGRDRAAE